jgi:hypothetical protein
LDYGEYEKIVEFLNSTPNFNYKNYSIPYDYPLAVSKASQLRAGLRRQIRLTPIVLVPAGMEASYREWIQFEIEVAQR